MHMLHVVYSERQLNRRYINWAVSPNVCVYCSLQNNSHIMWYMYISLKLENIERVTIKHDPDKV